ncbi:MAG: hypothetical protein WC376_01350 [Candidatus Nanoarchaeia archaeon]|jgi:hypothetical protein
MNTNEIKIKELSLEETIGFMKHAAKEKGCEVSYKIQNIGSTDGIHTDSLLKVKFYTENDEFSINYAIKQDNDKTIVYIPE